METMCQGIYPTVIIVLVSLKMTFYDDITHAKKTLTTFQAQGGINTLRTTVEPRRRPVDESEETAENTFVLEPFTHQSTSDQETMDNSNNSTKGENIV